MSRVAVIGNGGWGTALGLICAENGHTVNVWGAFAHEIDAIVDAGENALFLPGVPLSPRMQWTTDRKTAVHNAEVVILAVPTKYFHSVLETFVGLIPPRATLVSVAKGLDRDSYECMTAVAASILDHHPIAALSGPSHAEEVARGIPTAVTVACEDAASCTRLQEILSNQHFRIYTSTDVLGVQLGGALKNVIAIAVGVSDGLGFGDNTRAALITRGLAEMSRLGVALGADPLTFSGLSGIGDLIVTCTSRLSRNRAVGERIGRGERAEDILAGMKQAAEGAWNCAAAHALAREHGIDMPLTAEVFAIIHQGKAPRDAVAALLARDVKPE